MVGWHHRIDRHGFVCTLRVAERQGGLACCGSGGRKELGTTEQLTHEIKSATVSPSICHEVMGPDAMILFF